MPSSNKRTNNQNNQIDLLTEFVVKILREATGLSADSLNTNTPFSEIGLESLAILTFNSKISSYFPDIPKTLLFDCKTPIDAAKQLLQLEPESAQKFIAETSIQNTPETTPSAQIQDTHDWPTLTPLNNNDTSEEIAIIGMSGHFPDATTLDQFWKNLSEGTDSITEIPSERWSLEKFFQENTSSRTSGLSYAKWGGFLQNIDLFDAQFFSIPPREASLIDPQERLFLQCAWHAMEDAALLGEHAEPLKNKNGALEVGVFLGITTNTYPLLGPDSWHENYLQIPSGMPWSAANRVSYCFNFSGPSLAIDTACSSSLVAIHTAIESLRNQECKAAIVGGVNLYTHPAKYVQLCQQHMLSPTGRCHSFGEDADGFVPGEGVGAVILKPLSSALRDGDRIQAVIRGSAINHGGQTNGFTVPSPASQADLITSTLEKSALQADQISYIEAHGTGTKLGDPIELEALKKSLDSKHSLPCGVGSVKANIGHLESAAGIASLIKTCLQFKHKQITPSLHSSHLNPNLGIKGTRFYIPQNTQEWEPNDGIMRAGISSFGAGGTNAHLIVEQPPAVATISNLEGPLVFPLSASSPEQLNELVKALELHASAAQISGTDKNYIHSLAYTLQTGRESYVYRCAIIATTLSQVIEHCQDYSSRQLNRNTGWLEGKASSTEDNLSDKSIDLSSSPALLATHWVSGGEIRWSDLWTHSPNLVKATLYPFSKDSYWIKAAPKSPHNDSSSIAFNGQEFYLQDHIIKSDKVLPAAAYIDLSQREFAKAHSSNAVEISNLTWASPVTVNNPRSINFTLENQSDNASITFSTQESNKTVTHFRGKIKPHSVNTLNPTNISLQSARNLCQAHINTSDFYANFKAIDINYGPSFQCLRNVWKGNNSCLSELLLNESGRSNEPLTALDPALLDGVFQSAFFAANNSADTIESAYIPYSCKKLTLFAALTSKLFVYTEKLANTSTETETFNFSVFSEQGELLLLIEEFSFRHYQPGESSHSIHLLQQVWVENQAFLTNESSTADNSVLLFDQDNKLFDRLLHAGQTNTWLQKNSSSEFSFTDNSIITADILKAKQFNLFSRLISSQNFAPKTLIFNLNQSSSDSQQVHWESALQLEGISRLVQTLHLLCDEKIALKSHIIVLLPPKSNSAITGMLRSIHQEIPTLNASIFEIDTSTSNIDDIQKIISAKPPQGIVHLRLESSIYWKKQLQFIDHSSVLQPNASFQTGESILITGGFGALGHLFAKVLAGHQGLKLHLVGRSPLKAEHKTFLDELKALGALETFYWSSDCSKEADVQRLIDNIHTKTGPIHGIVHCAGALKDDFFIKQNMQDLEDVICSKALSTHWLDLHTKDDPIRKIILCSSLAGVHGNIGQSSYALANAWLDNFAEQRNQLATSNLRSGHCISIAWPLWKTTTGMQATDYVTEWLSNNGLSLLPEEEGMKLFDQALTSPYPQIIPVRGKQSSVAKVLGITATRKTESSTAKHEFNASIETSLQGYLSEHLASVTGTPLHKIDTEAALDSLGLDSILVMEVNRLLENDFPDLSKTALFEVRSINELSELIITEHASDAARLFPPTESANEAALTPASITAEPEQPQTATNHTAITAPHYGPEDIAIIGLAGHYPESSNLNELWEHLSAGHDLVREIPKRWPQSDTDDRAYARWGSFVNDVDKFDPLFFGISPRDAERMDPQERLFLQTAWHAVEDAGYTPESLSGSRNTDQRQRVGVIAGVMYGEYQFYGAKEWPKRPDTLTNSSYASIANRVSYCMDLDGPSFAIDSMCSSSLTSIHLACQLLQSGGCDTALAGGVNISSHPYKYRMLSDLQFASTEGKCRSFGEGGDGYVPGEGVGVVLLKPLSAAQRDNDHIYAIIRGSDLNHGGRTSGYTVPNADAQAQVISRAFDRCQTPVEHLNYIEAHGTGTSLGDPIEIKGLSKALRNKTSEQWRCPIGSVKSNLGHLESAAGMAALTKVLLQLKHKKLVPSIHSEQLNGKIDFNSSPFNVQQSLTDWQQRLDPAGQPLPRLAAISSFGAGGANAHIIVEEPALDNPKDSEFDEQLFVFSAQGPQQLENYLAQFVTYLEQEKHIGKPHLLSERNYNISDVANTLFHGRKHFEHKLAVVAKDFSILALHLKQWLSTPEDLRKKQITADEQSSNRALIHTSVTWLEGEKALFEPTPWRKVPLPGYQFLKRRYWVTEEIEDEEKPMPLTPSDVLDQMARKEISEEKAREMLLAMT